MFDGAAVGTVADALHPDAALHIADVPAAVEVRAADPSRDHGKKEVVVVDTSVADYRTLEAGVAAGIGIVEIDGSKDGLAQLAKWAQGQSGYAAIHILSPGAEGTLGLGSETLSSASFSDTAVQAELATIGKALSADGDLLLYACDLAAGNKGQDFVNGLAIFTGADIAASKNPTGNTKFGGDWTLEAQVGSIEADVAISTEARFVYDHTLGISSTNFDSSYGNDSYVNNDNTNSATYDGWQFGITGGTTDFLVGGCNWSSSYLNDSGNQNDASVTINYTGRSASGDSVSYYMKSADGTNFKLNSFSVSNTGELAVTSFSISGYRDGALVVASESVDLKVSDGSGNISYSLVGSALLAGNPGAFWGKVDFSSAFSNVDEIRFTFNGLVASDMATIGVDDVSISPANATPSISTPAGISLTDTFVLDTFANQTGNLFATDSDGSIASYGISGGATGGTKDFSGTIYDVSKLGTYGTLYVKSSTGAYVYEPNATAINAASSAQTETFTVTATDNGSATGTAMLTVNIAGANDTPTDIGLSASTVNQSAGTNATVGMLSSVDVDSGQSHTYSLVSGTGDTNNASFNISGSTLRANDASSLVAGTYSVRVQTSDGAGGSYQKTLSITVADNVAPAVPSAPDLAAASDSGSSNTDNLTNITTPTITGTAEAGSTVKLYDGATQVGSGMADGLGNWSITSSVLSEGSHTLTAKATDAANNTSGASTGLNLTIDTTVPVAPSAPDLTTASDSGSSNTDNLTKTTTPTFTGTAEANSTVRLYDTDGITELGTATATGGVWSITASSLSEGSHTLTAKATDAAGNVSAASSGLAITIDTTAPTTTVSTAAFSNDTGSSSADFITHTASQTVSGTLSANLASGETVKVSLDNGSTWTAASATVGQSTWSLAGQTLIASNTLKVKVTDAAGNDGSAYSQAYVLDTTAPSTTNATLVLSNDTGSSSTDFITHTASQTVSGTLSANLASGEIVQVSLDNGSTWTAASATVGQNTWSLAGQTLTASNTLKVKVSDAAGNDGAVSSQAYVLDTTAPSVPSAPDLTTASDSGSSNTDNLTKTTTPTFTGTAEANSTVRLYDTDGITVLGTAIADGSGNWSIMSSALSEGSHTLTARATDTAGNVSDASTGLAVIIDTAVPVISLTGSSLAYTEKDGATVIDSGAAVVETRSPGGAILTASISANALGSDQLSFATGTDAGINVSGTSLRSGTSVIGTVSAASVSGSTVLTITFSSTATASDIQNTVRELRYASSSADPTAASATRTVSFNLTDGAGNIAMAASRGIAITAIHDAPTDIALSSSSVSTYDTGTDVAVGTLSATDPDSSSFTYTVVSVSLGGAGQATSLFNVSGSTLQAAQPGTMSAGTYLVKVEVSDGDKTYQKTLSIVVDNSLTVTTTANEAYVSGETYAMATGGAGLSLAEAIGFANANGGGVITFAAGLSTLSVSGGTTVSSNITFDTSGASSLTISNGIVIDAGKTLTINTASGDNLTLSGVISGGGNLIKTGVGTLTLSGSDTFTGTTTINDGELVTGGSNVLSDSTVVTIGGSGRLSLGGSETIGALSSASSSAVVSLGANTLTTGADNSSTTYAGAITGTGGLTKTGTGSLTLSGINTYIGATIVSSGKLVVAGGSAIADTSAVSVAGTGTLELGSAEAIGALNGAGTVLLDGHALTTRSATATTFSGAITGSGGLIKAGTGTLTLSNATNSTSGWATTIEGGTLSISNHFNIGSGTLTLNGGTLNAVVIGNSSILSNTHYDEMPNAIVIGSGGGLSVPALAQWRIINWR